LAVLRFVSSNLEATLGVVIGGPEASASRAVDGGSTEIGEGIWGAGMNGTNWREDMGGFSWLRGSVAECAMATPPFNGFTIQVVM
jgi:hypothetical protein